MFTVYTWKLISEFTTRFKHLTLKRRMWNFRNNSWNMDKKNEYTQLFKLWWDVGIYTTFCDEFFLITRETTYWIDFARNNKKLFKYIDSKIVHWNRKLWKTSVRSKSKSHVPYNFHIIAWTQIANFNSVRLKLRKSLVNKYKVPYKSLLLHCAEQDLWQLATSFQ